MSKNILRDITTAHERTIRQVPLPRGRRATEPEEEVVMYHEEEYVSEPPRESGGPSRIMLWGVAFIFLLLLGFAVATGFSGATVTVTPKAALVEVNHEFIASKASNAKLAFKTITLEEAVETTIPADTEKKVTERASGKIIVYNAYSEKPQRLIKNTRFATPGGLIYRIGESIVIPGRKTTGGADIPGSREVVVHADSPGSEYNSGLTDFTVPGFKTDKARYSTFYARSKTPMTGGFDGVMRSPSDTALSAAREKLHTELSVKFGEKAAAAIPEGFVLYDGALLTEFESLPPTVEGNSARVREVGAATLYLFNRPDLERVLAKQSLPAQSEFPLSFPELQNLRLSWTEKPQPEGQDTVRFKLSGGIRVVWLFDHAKLQQSLLGRQKNELATILSAFPTIEKVDLTLRPFWTRNFPTDPKKVTIEQAELEIRTVEAEN